MLDKEEITGMYVVDAINFDLAIPYAKGYVWIRSTPWRHFRSFNTLLVKEDT